MTIDLDGLLADIGFGQRQLDPGLRADQHGAGILGRQLLDRLAAARIQRIEKCLGVVFDITGESAVYRQGEKGTGQDFAESVHVHFSLFGPGA